jgi:poly-gamma-glutamate synthesis protein (capsule biosynthesis protein)
MKIAFVGDLELGAFPFDVNYHKFNQIDPFRHVRNSLKKYDWVIGNLECSIETKYKSNSEMLCTKKLIKTIPENFILNVANNHINDYGPKHSRETFNYLNKHKIIGRKNKPYTILNYKNNTIGIIGASFVMDNKYKIKEYLYRPKNEEIKLLIKSINKKVNYLIFYVHWGSEFVQKINMEQLQLAQFLYEECNIDLLVGCHSHVIQNDYKLNKKPIISGLGSFISGYNFKKLNASKLLEIRSKNGEVKLHSKIFKGFKQPRFQAKKKIIYENINIANNYDIFIARNAMRVKIFMYILRNLLKYDKFFFKWIFTRFHYFIKNFYKEFFDHTLVYKKYLYIRKFKIK